ncbi:MAG: SDR family oxidoreductase [Rhodospirillaceae bacterium]|nr:SDR family oxidoreductase [Rhodospirillaceae bacterium]MBT4488240.1 SDR family oxidoreductase [Rhodospirillaceae bacterium]MBT5194807.1 SDR family oxidoreductase [Rhodospirillaceae bacterium]MBT6428790.1 SDR family oxidoreductase [Rhodospirillaceae bacterium]
MTAPTAKVAVVTGAARGIGLATAKRFLAEGWRVALLDIDGETLAAAAKGLNGALAVTCDVAKPDQVESAIDLVREQFGRIDALVNNAGTAVFKPLLQTSFEEWRRVLDVNLSGPFLCSQACAPLMIAQGGGSIVNITSISGLRASTLRVAYGTSKAGLMHLTKQQAAELGEVGIRVNAVSPGPVDTAMAKAVHSQAIRADYHDAIPLNRYGLEQEIAEAIWFLCSDRASYITGQTLAVDGGFDAVGIGLPSLREDM